MPKETAFYNKEKKISSLLHLQGFEIFTRTNKLLTVLTNKAVLCPATLVPLRQFLKPSIPQDRKTIHLSAQIKHLQILY